MPAGQVMPVPDGVDAGRPPRRCPRSPCTVWSNVFMVAGLQPGETLARARRRGRHRHLRDPARRRAAAREVFTTAGSRGEARSCAARWAPTCRSTTARRTSSRWCRTDGRRRRRDPRQHGREVPRPQRRRARHRGPAGRSSACRAAPRASSTSAPCCASAAAVIATSLRARPAGGEGRDLRGGRRARVAAGRRRARCGRSSTTTHAARASAARRTPLDGGRRPHRQDPAHP